MCLYHKRYTNYHKQTNINCISKEKKNTKYYCKSRWAEQSASFSKKKEKNLTFKMKFLPENIDIILPIIKGNANLVNCVILYFTN